MIYDIRVSIPVKFEDLWATSHDPYTGKSILWLNDSIMQHSFQHKIVNMKLIREKIELL